MKLLRAVDALLRGRVRVSAEMIARAAVGVKDATQALHAAWEATFRAPDLRARGAAAMAGLGLGLGLGGEEAGAGGGAAARPAPSAASCFSALQASLSSYTSEPRLLLAGLHENLLGAASAGGGSPDPTMLHTSRALDWLCFGEELSSRPGEGGGWVGGGVVGREQSCAAPHRASLSPGA